MYKCIDTFVQNRRVSVLCGSCLLGTRPPGSKMLISSLCSGSLWSVWEGHGELTRSAGFLSDKVMLAMAHFGRRVFRSPFWLANIGEKFSTLLSGKQIVSGSSTFLTIPADAQFGHVLSEQ